MNPTKPVVLIDLSSFIFYRFFAIQRWMTISGVELNAEQVLIKFAKLFEDNLKDIKKKLKVEWSNIVLARDCPRDKIWRMAVYPEYKGTRDAKRSPIFDPAVFITAYEEILPRMQKAFGFHVLQYETAEADDVIAIVHDEVRRLSPATPIHILSADTDFMQLNGPNTRVVNFQLKPLGSSFDDNKRSHYLLWKTIRGDASDNIPAIDKKIGDATAMKLAKNKDRLQERLTTSDAIRAAYERNDTLINFARIPTALRAGIASLVHAKITAV